MELQGVSKRYRVRGPWVLRDIDADLVPGQLIRVTGPNGCGKSTLLRLVSGASVPSRGRIAGRPRAGYVPERFPPALPFTAHAYLTHLGRLHGLRGGPLDAAVRGSIDRLGLGPYASLPMRELSKGTSQKVAVAQALLGRPGLLVMDEAWTGLDAGARATLDTVVAERVAEGAAVIFVDHDPARLADRVSVQWALVDGCLHESSVAGEVVGLARAGGAYEVDGDSEFVGVPAGVQTVVIEFAGYRGGLAGLRAVGGVVAAGPGWVRVRAGESDNLLRWLLAAEGDVHVERVAAE
ncbi:MAG TPA: ABC transporter ATP-binding protein [Streptosporangiaceae bacterium]